MKSGSSLLSPKEEHFLKRQKQDGQVNHHFETEGEALAKLREKYNVPDSKGVTPEDRKWIESLNNRRLDTNRNVTLDGAVRKGFFGSESNLLKRGRNLLAGGLAGLMMFGISSLGVSSVMAENLNHTSTVASVEHNNYGSYAPRKLAISADGATIEDLINDPVKSVIPNPSWYALNNQPDSALKTVSEQVADTIEKKVSVYIDETYAMVNGQMTTLDAPPQIIPPGRTYVPVRFIAENLGYTVGWDPIERKVTLSNGDKHIGLWIGKKYAVVNGVKIELDSAPFIDARCDRTYLPFRVLAEWTGAKVSWDPNDPMGRKASFDLKKTVYRTEEHKEIDKDSDADKDGLSFAIEKNFGTNPNDAHTISKFVTDDQVLKWAAKFNVDITNYNPVNDLSISANVLFGLDPNRADNFTSSLTDRQTLELYLSLGGSKIDFKSVYDSLHAFAGDLVSRYSSAEFVEGVFRGAKWGYIKADKDTLTNVGDKIFAEVKDSYNNRAYKKKADGTDITLDDLISRERVSTLLALNKVFAEEPINILLSQSPTLQKAAKEGNLQDYKELVDTLYKASNEMEVPAGKKIKELDVFKKYINQLGLFDHNAGEYAVQMWKQASPELREEIKSHPKLFLSYIGKNRAWVNAGKVKIGNREYDFGTVFQDIVKYTLDQMDYVTKTEKYFQEKGYELYQYSGYGDKIENLPFIWMQGSPFTPGLSHIELIKKKLSYGQMTLKEAIEDLMTTKGTEEILNIAEKRYHNVPIGARGCVSDFLGPGIGPKEYGSKPATSAMWVDVKVRGPKKSLAPTQGIPEANLPYGTILNLMSGKHISVTRAQAIEDIINLLQKNNPPSSERISTYDTGDEMAVEKIINNALIRFTIEYKWKSYRSELFILKDKDKLMDVGWINMIIMLNKNFGNPIKSSSNRYWTIYLPYEANSNNPLDFGRPFNVKKGQVYDLSLLP